MCTERKQLNEPARIKALIMCQVANLRSLNEKYLEAGDGITAACFNSIANALKRLAKSIDATDPI